MKKKMAFQDNIVKEHLSPANFVPCLRCLHRSILAAPNQAPASQTTTRRVTKVREKERGDFT
jgi:hypothetical protein